jgi:uncharacterized protein
LKQPNLWGRLKLLKGRVRRFYQNVFRPGFVRRSHARRVGECHRCGACCQMGIYCRHLDYDEEGNALCDMYGGYRTSNCRNFPSTEKDLRERDVVSPDVPCGFSFLPPDKGESDRKGE